MPGPDPLPFCVQAFQEPKKGQDAATCQDAFRLARKPDWNGDRAVLTARHLRAALADGATCSHFPRAWAKVLTSALVLTGVPLSRPSQFQRKLDGLGRLWRQDVERTLPLSRPWYVDEGLERGAFAALLTFSLRESSWEAQAVGDTCLFQVRDGSLLRAFPLEDPADFARAPYLVSSNPHKNRNLQSMIRLATGSARSGDAFLLATDAVAKWILARKGWNDLLELEEDSEAQRSWRDWVAFERGFDRLQDDDSTLLVVRVP